MATHGNQYEERPGVAPRPSAARRTQLDHLGRLPAGRGQRPEVVTNASGVKVLWPRAARSSSANKRLDQFCAQMYGGMGDNAWRG
jgi:hypothetical protein